MAKNQSTYTLRIDAELGNLQRILGQAQSSLQSFMATGSAPKGLEKAFEKIRDLLGQIQDKTGKPLDLKGLTGTGKSLDSVQESFSAIIRLLGEFDNLSDDLKLSFLTEEDKKRIESITASLQKYQATLVSISAQEKKLEAAKKTQAKDSGTISRVSKKISDTTDKKESLEAKRSTKQGQLDALTALGDKADPVRVAKLQGEIGQLNVEIGQLDKSLQEANEELEAAQASFASSSQEVERLEKSIKKTSGDTLKELKAEAEKLGISLDGLNGHKASEQMKMLTERMSQFKTEIANGAKPAFEEIRNGCKKGGDAAQKLGEDVEQAVDTVKEMDDAIAQRDAFEAKIKQFLGLQGAAQLLRAALRDAMSTIKELDATMTEMAVVTDLSVGDYWDQLPEYSKRATELGVSINSAYEAATLYYQQGLKTNEVVAISSETLKMAKIAGLDAADATDKMTAALRGFNMELNETSAQKISDVYSELAAITAADVDEISSAMTKTASIASSAGMEFETTAAFLSQIIETTRESAETAGTAMKTVIARFQELKKDPGEIGEVDGEIVDANAIETALRSVGVSLRDASGQFRDLDDVFLELSGKWNTLDKNTQRYIATIAAGSRQQSRFIAMMQDYGRTQDLVTAANNSAGASQRQFEKTLEGVEAKVEKLRNAWHEFTMGIMNSDLVKFGVDVLTKFLEVINKATSGIEGLGGSLVKIVGVLGVFKLGQKIFQKFRAPVIKLFADIVKEAGISGEKSAKAYKQGVKKAGEQEGLQEGYTRDETGRIHRADGSFAKKGEGLIKQEKKGLWEKTKDSVGITDFTEGKKTIKENGAKLRENKKAIKEKSSKLEELGSQKESLEIFGGDKSEIKELEKEIEKLSGEVEGLENEQEQLFEKQSEGWEQAGQGIQKVGETVTGLGLGVSALGGVFSALGLEQLGEGFAEVGNWITIAGTAISAFGGALKMIPPLLTFITAHPIIAMLTALLAILLAIGIALKKYNDSISLENRMKAAAEATAQAKEQAQEAKQAYDDLLADKDSYQELQNSLEELTYGTKEWKQALLEANQQVLELLQTYPELAKYVTRGEDGQLAISDEGWDAVIEKQQKGVLNSQALVIERQLDEQELKTESAMLEFDTKATIYRQDSEGNKVKDVTATKNLTEDLTDLYLVQGSSLTENAEMAEKLAKKYAVTTDQIWSAAAALEANKAEIEQIALETENIARSNLTAMASDKVTQSEYGEQVIDAFAKAQVSENYDTLVKEQAETLSQKDVSTNEQFKALAKEYGVQSKMTGDDEADLSTLYKAMAGVDEIPEELEGNKEELAKAVAEMKVANDTLKKMDEYTDRLKALSADDRSNIAGVLSQGGLGMSKDFANSIIAGFEDEDTSSNAALVEQAKKLGYVDDEGNGSVEKWAEALNMTVEEFYDATEKNARDAVTARTKAFEKMNRALGTTEEKIGNTAKLSAGQEEALANKIVSLSGIAGAEAAGEVHAALGEALDSVGNDADELANYLGSINWQDAGDWDAMKETLEAMGIAWTDEVADFANKARLAANAIKIIDFNKLNEDLKSVYNTIKSIKSGEQGRTFEEDAYKQLIAANKDLKDQFVNMGGEYVFIGSSMSLLTQALESNTKALLGEAKQQLDAKIDIAEITEGVVANYAGKNLDISQDYSQWSEQELRTFLTEFQDTAYEQQLALGENGDANALSYLDTEGLGLSFVTDFINYDKEKLVKMMDMIKENQANLTAMQKESVEKMKESIVLGYTQDNTGRQNAQYAKEARESGDSAGAELYSKALQAQAAQSGLVSEAVMARYAELIKDGVTVDEIEEVEDLEESMSNSLDQIIENQEGVEALISLQNRVADAIYETRQKEIDKLSELNESVQSANGALISKIQEQINDARQQRANEEAEENIANLQSQQAYLAMDSSGANALQVQGLDKQIADAEQAYQDTLVDQALQSLSDANEKAAEQRERQIALMQQQLDYSMESGAIMAEAVQLTNESLDDVNKGVMFENTAAGQLITTAEQWDGKAPEEYKKDMEDLQTEAVKAANTQYEAPTQESEDDDTESITGSGESGDSISDIAEIVREKKAKEVSRETAVQSITGGSVNEKGEVARNFNIDTSKFSTRQGFQGIKTSQEYKTQEAAYMAAGGTSAEFEQRVRDEIRAGGGLTNGSIDGVTVSGLNSGGGYSGKFDAMTVKIDDDKYDIEVKHREDGNDDRADSATASKLTSIVGGSPQNSWIAMYNGIPYMYIKGDGRNTWFKIAQNDDTDYSKFKSAYKTKLNAFETGGLADFTGPAWLDGTRSRPEYVLNARQTERFFSLVDVLEGFDTKKTNSKSSGDNYFDINISVEKIEDDYDVEQMANKIRSMIYEDATYRNVNAINHIR